MCVRVYAIERKSHCHTDYPVNVAGLSEPMYGINTSGHVYTLCRGGGVTGGRGCPGIWRHVFGRVCECARLRRFSAESRNVRVESAMLPAF